MSIEFLKSIFESINPQDAWELQLLKITSSKRKGTSYNCRQISLTPEDKMFSFIEEIKSRYLSNGKGSLNKYTNITDYDGTADSLTIYKLDTHNELISNEYDALLNAVSNPDEESDPFAFMGAYLLKGEVEIDDTPVPVKLVCMQRPVTTLKHKFAFFGESGSFRELDDKVLSLKPTIDVIILESEIYFLNMSGENLFNMARAYKTVCSEKIEEIEVADFINDIEVFKEIAASGHNPRKFISFNAERFNSLKDTRKRKSMAKKFNLPLDENGNFDMTQDGAADRLVKVLCDKGMVDPFKNLPVEVSSSKPW